MLIMRTANRREQRKDHGRNEEGRGGREGGTGGGREGGTELTPIRS